MTNLQCVAIVFALLAVAAAQTGGAPEDAATVAVIALALGALFDVIRWLIDAGEK